MNQTRYIAFRIIKNIMLKEGYSNLTLRKELDEIDVEKRPAITRMVYGTIENFMYVRYAWQSYVQKLPKDELATLLDMSVYQLLFMDHQAPYAIIDDMVEIAKRKISGNGAGMVNAVLRKVAQNKMPPLPKETLQALSIQTSHPLWLIQMWNAQYGEEVCRKICMGNMQPRKSVGRVNTLKIQREELLAKESSFHASMLSSDGFLYDGGSIANTVWYQEGYVSIQDEASQMVAFLLDPQPKERVLDVCSAPGTKACHIAQRMHNQGEVICGDIHEHRVQLIQEGADRLGITCMKASVMDATILAGLQVESFDRVLCDVPCSGYGTLSRKSDIKLRMKSSDMDTLIPLQAQILKRGSEMVKPQGILVYSTCTLNKKENEKQIEKFLKEHPTWTLLKQETIFPFTYDSDGFFLAKLQKGTDPCI